MEKSISWFLLAILILSLTACSTGRGYRGKAGYYNNVHGPSWGGFYRNHRHPVIIVPPGGGPIGGPEAVQLPSFPDAGPGIDIGGPDLDVGTFD